MGGTFAIQTQCCLMKRDEHDEDDISDSERAEEGAKEKTVQVVGAQPWSGGRPGSPSHGTPPCVSAQVSRSLSEAPTLVPVNLRN